MTVGIIGAGASGMAAALTASENPQIQVILMERQARVGRKLLATGNGRCNLSNLHADASHYHGEEAAFCAAALTRYSTEETLGWFHGLGLYTVAEPSGRVYPYSDQANSVVDVLRFALDRPNVHLLTGFEVSRIRKNSCGFTVESGAERVTCEKLIIACGGLAGTKLGGSMAGYKLLRSMGHRATKLRPALVQLRSSWAGVTSLKGVRANCRAEILHDGNLFAHSIGELQFTEYGLSGPVIFEISRDVCAQPGRWICRMDFLPDHSEEELTRELHRRRNTGIPAEELLTGVLHNRLGRVLTQAVGIRPQQPASRLEDGQLRMLAAAVKSFEVELTEPLGMDSAQVTAGGIMTADFDPKTMESRLVPGLYACGEVLDVDGDCGGYNLQWAWSSGRLAGSHAGRE
jgi:predicted Rossmann fold flavoprotein